MSRIDKIIDLSNLVAIPAAPAFAFCMVVYPLIDGGFSWRHVHAVWMDWQTLNVGVFAFFSSLIAFNISRYHANQQRHREFIAARSFLPEALSELITYFQESAKVLTDAFEILDRDRNTSEPRPSFERPVLPEGYREVFSRCISLADADVAEYLSGILMQMQIHNARITSLIDGLKSGSRTVHVRSNIIVYLYKLGELYVLTAKIFEYARGLQPYKKERLKWEDFRNAYSILDVDVEEIEGLEEFTIRAIGRAEAGDIS